MSTDTFGNLDIWTNILQYFKLSLELDSESEAKEKRKCLLRVALLSPSLTTPALDLLWQNMTSLVPVTQMINVNLEPLFFFPEVLRFSLDHGGFWVCLDSTYRSYCYKVCVLIEVLNRHWHVPTFQITFVDVSIFICHVSNTCASQLVLRRKRGRYQSLAWHSASTHYFPS